MSEKLLSFVRKQYSLDISLRKIAVKSVQPSSWRPMTINKTNIKSFLGGARNSVKNLKRPKHRRLFGILKEWSEFKEFEANYQEYYGPVKYNSEDDGPLYEE